ncbi:hypothetical protein RYX36_020277 [Vicia faba]
MSSQERGEALIISVMSGRSSSSYSDDLKDIQHTLASLRAEVEPQKNVTKNTDIEFDSEESSKDNEDDSSRSNDRDDDVPLYWKTITSSSKAKKVLAVII